MEFWIAAIIVIAGLIAARMTIRAQHRRVWKEVYVSSARSEASALDLAHELDRNHIRTKIVYKGPLGSPFIGMSGNQLVAVEVHRSDLERATPIISSVLQAQRGDR